MSWISWIITCDVLIGWSCLGWLLATQLSPRLLHFSIFQNQTTFLPSALHIRTSPCSQIRWLFFHLCFIYVCVCGHQFSLCCDHYLWCELCTLHWRKPCWRVYDSWESKLGVTPYIENCFFIRKLWHYISGKHAYRCLFVILHQQPFVERDLYATFSLRDLCPYVYCTEKEEKKGRSDRTDFFQICHCTRLCVAK